MENKLNERNKKKITGKKIIHLEHTYYHSIETIWKELRDLGKWNSKENITTKYKLLKGKEPWDVGSQFLFYYKDYIPLVYETLKFYEDDFAKQMVIECIENPALKIDYILDYNLYKNTLNGTTILTLDFISFDEMPNFMIDLVTFDFKRTFKINNKYFNMNRNYETEQVESCILKKNKNAIWKLLFSDFNNFSKLIPGLADEIIFKDEKLSLNSEFILKFNKENLEVPFRVSLYQNEENIGTWKIGFSIIDSNKVNKKSKNEFYIPFQDISFEIFDIDFNIITKSMFIFKHTFKEKEITMENLQPLINSKIVLMKTIKNLCRKL